MRQDQAGLDHATFDPTAWLRPGVTCWRREHADRVALLHDGAAYFAAARAAILKAQASVLLIGWSFDPRAKVLPDPNGGTDHETIAEVLRALKATRPEVAIRLLIWDMPWPINRGKELSPDEIRERLGPDIDYRIDSRLPYGACQHQKILVVDDSVAFCGGSDFESDRWDTVAHRDREPRRRLPNGESYTPRHDVMLLVDNGAATALADLACWRWREATGERLDRVSAEGDPWPEGVLPVFEKVPLALVRTLQAEDSRAAIRESEALYFTAIAEARKVIYLENQYFGSPPIAEALARRLSEPDGPEIIVIVAAQSPNTFDRLTMDCSRRGLIEMLRASDPHGRLRILAPHTPRGTPILVHSKVAVFDDRMLRVGSTNLNNRSFGYDSECDLAIEAGDGETQTALRAAITRTLHALLAHHAGLPREVLARSVEERGSIGAVLDDAFQSTQQTLRPVEIPRRGPVAWLIETFQIGDPVDRSDAWKPWRRRAALQTVIADHLRRPGTRLPTIPETVDGKPVSKR